MIPKPPAPTPAPETAPRAQSAPSSADLAALTTLTRELDARADIRMSPVERAAAFTVALAELCDVSAARSIAAARIARFGAGANTPAGAAMAACWVEGLILGVGLERSRRPKAENGEAIIRAFQDIANDQGWTPVTQAAVMLAALEVTGSLPEMLKIAKHWAEKENQFAPGECRLPDASAEKGTP